MRAKPIDNRLDDFEANLPFKEQPTQQDVIDRLKVLRPNREYYLGSVRIEYICNHDLTK